MTDTAMALDGATSRVRRRNYGRNHAYYLTMQDGSEVKLGGVTTLINAGLPKPKLLNWAARTVAEKAVDQWAELALLPPSQRMKSLEFAHRDVRDEAASKGTLIHALAEKIIAGEEVEVPDLVRRYVDSAVQFLDDFRIRPVMTETTVWNEAEMYAGTTDGIVTSDVEEHRGKTILFDWKSSRSGIFNEAALQCAAYRYAEFYQDEAGVDHPMAELGITDVWGVWVTPDGYDALPLTSGPESFEAFKQVAAVARLAAQMDEQPLVGEPLDVPPRAA